VSLLFFLKPTYYPETDDAVEAAAGAWEKKKRYIKRIRKITRRWRVFKETLKRAEDKMIQMLLALWDEL
jgi:hypothetical protein